MRNTTNKEERQIVKFTDRQIEIIKCWIKYKSAAQAAEQLEIKEDTFHTHLKRLRRKLAVHRTVDVYVYMNQEGLV